MSEQRGYWQTKTLSRRTILRGAGASAAGLIGAGVIGCATAPKAAPANAPGAATPSAGQPKRGGINIMRTIQKPDNLDPMTTASVSTASPAAHVYSRLVMLKPGDGKAADGTVAGDVAERWEQPDEKTYIFRMRKGIKYDDRAPTNGREMNSEDVVQSWKRYEAGNAYRTDLSNAANKRAPVTKVEAIDPYTVKWTLAFEDAIFLPVLGHVYQFYVMPIESANGGFDPKSTMRGSGAWTLKEFIPSVGIKYARNPKWHFGPERPYFDEEHELLITEDAQMEVQFRAGKLGFGGGGAAATALAISAAKVPDTQLIKASPATGGGAMYPSYRNGHATKDVRVRRALSMATDRNVLAEVAFEPKRVEALGLKVTTYWNTPLSGGYGAYWLDPQGPKFGENAKYFKLNIAESVKQLQAAGFTKDKPFTVELVYTPQYAGTDRRCELLQSMWKETGGLVSSKIRAADYTTEWLPKFLRGHADFAGQDGGAALAAQGAGGRSDPIQWFEANYASWGANNATGEFFPDLDKKLIEARRTMKYEERVEKIHDIQRYMGEQLPSLPTGPLIDEVSISYKWLKGPERYQAWEGGFTGNAGGNDITPYWYFDK